MPTYLYECEKCGKIFEIIQSMKDEALTELEHSVTYKDGKGHPCEGKVHRIITGGCGFILKGTGWTKPRTKSQKKVDEALKQAGIDDESGGYEVGE